MNSFISRFKTTTSFISQYVRVIFTKPSSLLIGLLCVGLLSEISLRFIRISRDPEIKSIFHSNLSLYSTSLIRPSAESQIGFVLKANLKSFYKGKEFSTNSQGFRDQNRSLSSAPGWRRVAVLGRSYEMGTAVSDSEAWPRLLDHLLENQKIEVLNFGVEGYTLATLETIFHRFVKNYKPTWVILPIYYEEIDSLIPLRTPRPPSFLKKWSSFGYYLDAFYFPRFLQFEVWNLVLAPNQNDWMYFPRAKSLTHTDQKSLPSLEPLEPYMTVVQRLISSIQQEGAQVIILPMPRVIPPYPHAYLKGKNLHQAYAHHRKGVFLFKELESLQLQLNPHDLDIPGDPHFNASFHRRLAKKVYDCFQEIL